MTGAIGGHPDGPVGEAAELFRSSLGREPDGVWSGPGRVNLIGEHTDYNDGFVLPIAAQRRAAAAVSPRGDGLIRVASTIDGLWSEVPLADLVPRFDWRSSALPRWARYPVGVAWALLDAAGARPGATAGVTGVDIALASDVPIGAGLSSSTAIQTAIAMALRETWGLMLDGVQLARACRRSENEAVGAPTGIMDQLVSMFGVAGSAVLIDCRTLSVEPIPLSLESADLQLLVIDTRVRHAHVNGGYGERRAACERGAAALGVPALRDLEAGDLVRASQVLDEVTHRRVRHVVTENRRVRSMATALREGRVAEIGPLLTESHRSMRDDFEISVPELDLAVATACETGALGARMTGGGFGGASIALVPRDSAERVESEVRRAFAAEGFRPPEFFAARASAGARRER
ncbi:galactokinase [Leucobacter sp. wl10]|uniref:galactokinase n=1 Tax=Leucobacter sp. wl10 TaxID=2304677 RepID=UPI000E5A356D|nr:galactokinase [Leucobacter sp. wl10]RGE16044.1 galactokinase [Leucobacter sp. wl10]